MVDERTVSGDTSPLRFAAVSKLWRIVLAVIIFQSVGAAISLSTIDHHDVFRVIWEGGAFGTLPGFVVGLIWQTHAARGDKGWVLSAALLGFISFVLLIAAILHLRILREETHELELLSGLVDLDFNRIEVYERCGRKRLKTIMNPETIAAFTDAIGKAEGDTVKHYRYTDAWFVALRGGWRWEFLLYFEENTPNHVVGEIVYLQHGRIRTLAHFRTRTLRSWVETHFPRSPHRNC